MTRISGQSEVLPLVPTKATERLLAGKERRVSQSAYRVSISDEVRAAAYERERLRSSRPREFKENYELKKELSLQEEAAVAKMAAGGARFNAEKLLLQDEVQERKLAEATAAFRYDSDKIRAQLLSRTAYGPQVASRKINTKVGPDGATYIESVNLSYELPATTGNAYQDYQQAHSIGRLATSSFNPGGADYQLATQARLTAQIAYERFQEQVRSRGEYQEEGMWAEEIKAKEAQALRVKNERIKELSNLGHASIQSSQTPLYDAFAAQKKNTAITFNIARKGIELANIPLNFRKYEVNAITYSSTYNRYVNSTLTATI